MSVEGDGFVTVDCASSLLKKGFLTEKKNSRGNRLYVWAAFASFEEVDFQLSF